MADYNTSIERYPDQPESFFPHGGIGAGQSRSRPQIGASHNQANTFNTMFNSRGATNFADNSMNEDLAMLFNQERIQKINQLKDTLGTSREDLMLKKQLAKFEDNLMGRNQIDPQRKTGSLAKKNLEKVYGKVRDKMSSIMDFHEPRDRKILNQSNQSYQGDEAEVIQDRKTQKNFFSKDQQPGLVDSRMRNLEKIYIKGIGQDMRAASTLLKQRSKQQTMQKQ